MSKNYYFSQFLLLAVVCVYFYSERHHVSGLVGKAHSVRNDRGRTKSSFAGSLRSVGIPTEASGRDGDNVTRPVSAEARDGGHAERLGLAQEERLLRYTRNDGALVKRMYDGQIGVRETGNNSDSAVEQYLNYVHLKKGEPWCAAFVCWVYGQAGVVNPRSGWSPNLFPTNKIIWDRGKQTKPPSTADIFAIYFPEKGRIAHTGFVDRWDGNWLTTVEGNTNDNNSREGDGVYRKRRMVRSIYKVARYIN